MTSRRNFRGRIKVKPYIVDDIKNYNLNECV